jgi:hypothetical protein
MTTQVWSATTWRVVLARRDSAGPTPLKVRGWIRLHVVVAEVKELDEATGRTTVHRQDRGRRSRAASPTLSSFTTLTRQSGYRRE